MSASQEKLPFANTLRGITEDILRDNAYVFYSGYPISSLEANIDLISREFNRNKGEDRTLVSEIIVHGLQFFVTESIAYSLLETQIFSKWSDSDKRFLLDFALTSDIVSRQMTVDPQDAEVIYYGQMRARHRGDTRDSRRERVTYLQNMRARLRERVSISAPRTRR